MGSITPKRRLPGAPLQTTWAFWLALAGVGGVITLFFVLGLRGWPGSPDSCLLHSPDTCYCERADLSNFVRQPANTWSNLGFIASGLLILWRVGHPRPRRLPAANPLAQPGAYAIGYGLVVVALGPASMFFHGSQRAWGGWLDLFSMMLYSTFLLVYNLVRIRHASGRVFLTAYVPLVLAQGLANALVPKSGQLLFGGTIVLVLVLEAAILRRGVGGLHRQGWPWLAAALLTFAGAYGGVWLWSNTAGPWCVPSSLIQGHALWHLLCAVSTGCFYLYLCTETSTNTSP